MPLEFAVSACPSGLRTIPNTYRPFVSAVPLMREQRVQSRALFGIWVILLLTIDLALHYRSEGDFIALPSVLPLPSRPLGVLCHSSELDMSQKQNYWDILQHCKLVSLLETVRCVVIQNFTEQLSNQIVLVMKTRTTRDYGYSMCLGKSSGLEMKGSRTFLDLI